MAKTLTPLTNSKNRWRKDNLSGMSWCWLHETNTHGTPGCYSVKILNDRDKVEMLRKKGVSYNNMAGQHFARFCTIRDGCTVMTKDS